MRPVRVAEALASLYILAPVLSVQVSDCSIQSLVLPIQNATLNNGTAVNRGVRVDIGGQELGLRVSFIWNITR
jgi:hypothetical protein